LKRLLTIFLLLLLCSKTRAQTSEMAAADSLYATGSYTKAINHYAQAGTQKSSLQIARAYNAIGNNEKAIAQYRDLLGKNPSMQIAQFELGKLLVKTKEFDEARKLFSNLVGTEKENPEYYYYLGEVYNELDQPASSINAYKNAVDKDSTHLRSLFRLGKTFVVKQEKKQALFYINKGLEFYPDDVSLINLKALVLFNDAAYEKAIPWFERVLELGETKKYVYEKLAYCHYKNWDFEKAKTAHRILIEMNPENPEVYYNMAETLRKNKQLDSAEVFIKKGMDVQKPIFAKGYSYLGGLARERNDLKLAFEYYRLAHKEYPHSAMGYFHVCTAADRYFKDPKVKLKYYEKYFELYEKDKSYFSVVVSKRVTELKEEIHFAKE